MFKSFHMTGRLLFILTSLLIFWLTFGRAFLGSAGWMSFTYILFGAPVIIIAMILFAAFASTTNGGNQKKSYGTTLSLLLIGMFLVAFLHGFFIVDFADSNNSSHSAATTVFGMSFLDTSAYLSTWFFNFTIGLYVVSFLYVLYQMSIPQKNAIKTKGK